MATIPDYRSLPQRQGLTIQAPQARMPLPPDMGGAAQETLNAQMERARLREASDAKTAFYLAKTELDNQVDEDQDYATAVERYDQAMQKTLDESLSGVASAYVRQQLRNEFELSIAEGRAKTHDMAEVRRKDHELGALYENLGTMERAVGQGKMRPQEAISAIDTGLAAAVAADNLTDVQAQATKTKFQQNTVLGWVQNLTPGQQLKALKTPLVAQVLDGTQIAVIRSRAEAEQREAYNRYLQAKSAELVQQTVEDYAQGEITAEQGILLSSQIADKRLAADFRAKFSNARSAIDSARASDYSMQANKFIQGINSGTAPDPTQSPEWAAAPDEVKNTVNAFQRSVVTPAPYNSDLDIALYDLERRGEWGDARKLLQAAERAGVISPKQTEKHIKTIAERKTPDGAPGLSQEQLIAAQAGRIKDPDQKGLFKNEVDLQVQAALASLPPGVVLSNSDLKGIIDNAFLKITDPKVEGWAFGTKFSELGDGGKIAAALLRKIYVDPTNPANHENLYKLGTAINAWGAGSAQVQAMVDSITTDKYGTAAPPPVVPVAPPTVPVTPGTVPAIGEGALSSTLPAPVLAQSVPLVQPALPPAKDITDLRKNYPEIYDQLWRGVEAGLREKGVLPSEIAGMKEVSKSRLIWGEYGKQQGSAGFTREDLDRLLATPGGAMTSIVGVTGGEQARAPEYVAINIGARLAAPIFKTLGFLNTTPEQYREKFVETFGNKFGARDVIDLKHNYPDQYAELKTWVKSQDPYGSEWTLDKLVWETYTDMAEAP